MENRTECSSKIQKLVQPQLKFDRYYLPRIRNTFPVSVSYSLPGRFSDAYSVKYAFASSKMSKDHLNSCYSHIYLPFPPRTVSLLSPFELDPFIDASFRVILVEELCAI